MTARFTINNVKNALFHLLYTNPNVHKHKIRKDIIVCYNYFVYSYLFGGKMT